MKTFEDMYDKLGTPFIYYGVPANYEPSTHHYMTYDGNNKVLGFQTEETGLNEWRLPGEPPVPADPQPIEP